MFHNIKITLLLLLLAIGTIYIATMPLRDPYNGEIKQYESISHIDGQKYFYTILYYHNESEMLLRDSVDISDSIKKVRYNKAKQQLIRIRKYGKRNKV